MSFCSVVFQSTPVIANGRIPSGGLPHPLPSCFNPRPLLLTGESALLSVAVRAVASFQSTPVIANGRIARSRASPSCSVKFQSTPVIANGRISGCGGDAYRCDGFNPRPLLLTGESIGHLHPEYNNGLVSIHARYC